MAMSRKNYNAIATNFGASIRNGISKTDTYYATTYGAWLMVEAFIEAACEDNPAFDPDRFRAWVEETAEGTRDRNGKRVGRQSRSQVVTVMGHTNQGKDRLLDAIRNTKTDINRTREYPNN